MKIILTVFPVVRQKLFSGRTLLFYRLYDKDHTASAVKIDMIFCLVKSMRLCRSDKSTV